MARPARPLRDLGPRVGARRMEPIFAVAGTSTWTELLARICRRDRAAPSLRLPVGPIGKQLPVVGGVYPPHSPLGGGRGEGRSCGTAERAEAGSNDASLQLLLHSCATIQHAESTAAGALGPATSGPLATICWPARWRFGGRFACGRAREEAGRRSATGSPAARSSLVSRTCSRIPPVKGTAVRTVSLIKATRSLPHCRPGRPSSASGTALARAALALRRRSTSP